MEVFITEAANKGGGGGGGAADVKTGVKITSAAVFC